MNRQTYVVINSRDQFWNGTGWSAEYPEAVIFECAAFAKKAMPKSGVEFTVIRDYGLESERAVYHQYADGIPQQLGIVR